MGRHNFRGSEVQLHGIQLPKATLEEEERAPNLHKGYVKGIWLQFVGGKEDKKKKEVDPVVLKLVKKFQEVFAEPHSLPPLRSHGHKIELREGSKRTYVRPYRYPYYQKAEIECLVAEMLKSGIIRGSQSPYSSPMLLVRKADGSWRMCVDYCALNKYTVKDKYHIPNIDELLDELYGALKFFLS